MKQAEWLQCREPDEMLDFLRKKVNDRKLRLFQIACCRRIWDVLPTDAHRDAVLMAEQYAEGQTTEKKRIEASKRIRTLRENASQLEINASYAVFYTLEKSVFKYGSTLGCTAVFALIADKASRGNKSAYQKAFQAEEAAEADLLRCIFGNPFRRVALKAKWKTSDVVALAKQMYESREFSAMPILADALQDAECDNDTILDHCRGPGPHVRGCWVVDLILGKE